MKVLQTSKKNCLVKCNYCDKQFWIGSGNRIRAHLGVENISGVAKCSSVPEEVVVWFMQAEADKISRNAEMSKKRALDIATKGDIGSFALASSSKQPKITTVCDKQKKAEVDEAVARMCYSTGVSFNVVNNKHFREMCQKIGQYGPTYQVTSDYPIRTTLLQKEYDRMSRRVDEFHNEHLSRTGGTIVSDGWSDAQRRPLLNFLLVTPAGK